MYVYIYKPLLQNLIKIKLQDLNTNFERWGFIKPIRLCHKD